MTKQQPNMLVSLYGQFPTLMKKSVFMGSAGLFLFVLGVCLLMWESECFRANMKSLVGGSPTPVDTDLKCDNLALDQMHMAGLIFITLSTILLFLATVGRMNLIRM